MEGRKKKCWNCRKFGHLAYNCRTKREEEKRRGEKPQNKYKVLTTRVMQYRVRDVQCTLWPLREVWLKVGLEKLENHKGVAVKALLDSGATGLFTNATFAKEKGFKMEKCYH